MASIFQPNLFTGKVAIVTGGGSGIGKCIATELSTLGCKVVIASRNLEKLEKAAAEMSENVFVVQCNIRKETDVERLMEQTLSQFGRLDFLINNGGGQFPSPAANISLKGWEAVVQTNLTGTFLCCKAAYHAYMSQHGGKIVNIIANVSRGFPGMAHTGAARAGAENLTKTLAIEWASTGIQINSVAPGIIWSETATANYDNGLELFQKVVERSPARRMGTTQEVSAAVVFLLSPAATYITGDTIKVDGGMHLYGDGWEIPPHSTCQPFGPLPKL